jgi:hypothetical protein
LPDVLSPSLSLPTSIPISNSASPYLVYSTSSPSTYDFQSSPSNTSGGQSKNPKSTYRPSEVACSSNPSKSGHAFHQGHRDRALVSEVQACSVSAGTSPRDGALEEEARAAELLMHLSSDRERGGEGEGGSGNTVRAQTPGSLLGLAMSRAQQKGW